MKEKQVQIPMRLLDDIAAILDALTPLVSVQIHPDDVKYLNAVRSEIKAKFERMERHETFTQYKTAEPGSERREFFRERYLDQAGVSDSFRTAKERSDI